MSVISAIDERGSVKGRRGWTHRRKMGAHLRDVDAEHEAFRKWVMTNKQRLMYSILIALAVLAIMLGLSHLQNSGVITEKTFQYIAIGVAVLVVVLNGIMRRKVKR